MKPPKKQGDGTPFELFCKNHPWITKELIEDTLQTWQPYYNYDMSVEDAVEILQNFGRLINHLQEYER